ncbi:MAG: dockerin type I domain-containing protein [Candidatus Zixiibacteriota bacterium]
MKIISALIFILMIAFNLNAQVNLVGDLTAHVDSLVASIPGSTPAGLYLQPGSTSRTLWRQIIQNILIGDYGSAHNDALTIDYRVVVFADNSVSPTRDYIILERTPESTSRYWGTFIFNPDPLRYKLVIEAPHSRYDINTGYQAFRIFYSLGSRALFINGIHRCNGTTESTCDGTTSACGESGPYKYSDQAHVVLGTFQVTTEELLNAIPDMIVVQPHGFTKESGDPDIIMSNGTRYTPTEDLILILRDNLLTQDNSLTFKIAHIDLDWDKLVARTNTQGRLLNGSPDPCGTYASSCSGGFIHLEQAYSKLRDTEINWYKLVNALAQTFPVENMKTTIKTGSWSDPGTWSDATLPTSEDDVRINSGHIISIDDNVSECHSIIFADTSAHLDMNSDSRLSVTGNFSLAAENHNVFSAGWSATNARIRFAGAEPLQILSGWSTTGGSTSFRNLIIDKPSGIVVTAGTGMRLGIQNSLEIIKGTLEFSGDDDLEARWASNGNLTNNQDLQITVYSQGKLTFIDGDGAHFIRSNIGSVPIGTMTIYGEVEFYDASSYDISINNINIKDGGILKIGTGLGSTTYGPEFNPGIITVDSGGTIYSTTTSDIWFDSTQVDLKHGAVFKTSASATIFPPTFINDGKVRYQRDPEEATTDQVVNDTNYNTIEFSFNGNETKKLWTLNASRVVAESLIVDNDAELIIDAEMSQNLLVENTLRLTSGILNNSDIDVTLTMADEARISRGSGNITAPPIFSGVVDLIYTNSTEMISTGPEMPLTLRTLNNLTITGSQNVSLSADLTVNGILELEDATILTGSYSLNLADNANIVETPEYIVQGTVNTNRILSQNENEEFGNLGLQILASGNDPGITTVIRITAIAQSIPGITTVSRTFDIIPSINSGLDAILILEYAEAELNGISETDLVMYSSIDGGQNWILRGGAVDTFQNTVTLDGINSFSLWTLGMGKTWTCGDVDNSGSINILDITYLIAFLYKGGPSPDPLDKADVNNSGDINILDITFLITYLYKGGAGPFCGK